MKLKIVLWLSIGFIGLFFGRTSYNNSLDKIEKYFSANNFSFTVEWDKVSSETFFSEDKSTHLLNLISFKLKNSTSTDTASFKLLDSLISNYSSILPKEEAIFTNQEIIFNFLKKNKTLLLNSVPRIDEDFLEKVKGYTANLKTALEKDPSNEVIRHNFFVLSKFYKENNIYSKTATKLRDLIFEQLKSDLYNDSLDLESSSIKLFTENKRTLIEKIKSQTEQEICKTRIKDTLENYLTNKTTEEAKGTCLDSLKYHENIDLHFLNELKSGKSSNEIINNFYGKNYPNLYQKSFVGSINELMKDSIAQDKIQKIICDYLPEECNKPQEKPEEKDSETQEKDSEKEDSDQKNQKSQNQSQNEEGEQDNQQKKKDEMKKQMSEFDEHQNEQNQKNAQKDNSENKNSNSSQKPQATEKDDDKTTKDLFKKLEDQNDAYQKNKLKEMPYNMDDSKPSW